MLAFVFMDDDDEGFPSPLYLILDYLVVGREPLLLRMLCT